MRAASARASASSGHPAKRSGKPSRTIAAHEPEMDTTDSLPAKARRNARAVLRAESRKPEL